MEVTTVSHAAENRELWQAVIEEECFVIHDYHRGPMSVSAIRKTGNEFRLCYTGGFERPHVSGNQLLRVFTVTEMTAAVGMQPAILRQVAIDLWDALPPEMTVKRAVVYPPLIDALEGGTVDVTYQGHPVINIRYDPDDTWLLDTGNGHIAVQPDDRIQIHLR